MAQQVTLNYHGVEGVGRNVTEAKKDAGRTIQKIVARLTPAIYSHRGHSVVVYPNSCGGTNYTLIHPDTDGQSYSCSCGGEYTETIADAVRHLLSITRQIGEYDVPEWVPGSIDRRELIGDWKRHDAFQRAYRVAEKAGDPDPHGWACRHQYEDVFQLPLEHWTGLANAEA